MLHNNNNNNTADDNDEATSTVTMKIIAYESNDAIPSAVADKATVHGHVEGRISCCYRRRDEATSSVTRMII